ncbi:MULTISPECIES: hypothetical protein [Devosia]|nr:hypothetical protein [Devosia neptuniae]MCZ4346009.1 hypothetical protein [Devosia neptuniae]
MENIGHFSRQKLMLGQLAGQVVRRVTALGVIDAGQFRNFLDHVFAKLD